MYYSNYIVFYAMSITSYSDRRDDLKICAMLGRLLYNCATTFSSGAQSNTCRNNNYIYISWVFGAYIRVVLIAIRIVAVPRGYNTKTQNLPFNRKIWNWCFY